MYLSDFKAGDLVTWWRSRPHSRVQEQVPATVLRVGAERVVIVVDTPQGQERRAVLPDNIEHRSVAKNGS